MDSVNQFLSNSLKSLRKTRSWSLDRAAAETGVSKAMLGQVERGESSPTIATLWKIASGFNVSLSSFLEPPPEEKNGIVFRSPEHLRQQPASDNMLVAPLFPYDSRYKIEMFELTLMPGYERLSEPHEEGMTEHVIVQSGCMEIFLESSWRSLAKGEAVRFAADKIHGYRNLTEQPAIFYNINHYL